MSRRESARAWTTVALLAAAAALFWARWGGPVAAPDVPGAGDAAPPNPDQPPDPRAAPNPG